MGQSRLNTERRAVRVALSSAALAFVAGAAFGVALLTSSTATRVIGSGSAAIATPTAAGHSVVAVSVISSVPRGVLGMSSYREGDTGGLTLERSAWRLELLCTVRGRSTLTAPLCLGVSWT